jgi:transposase InsO family protein
LFGVSTSYYYKLLKRGERKEEDEEKVLSLIKRERRILKVSGGKKMYYKLKPKIKEMGIKMGRDKFIKLLRANGLLVKRKRYRMPKTDSNHPFRKYKNLLKDRAITRIDELWVSDITYIKVLDKWYYLTLVMDLYSRRIMGYSFSKGMSVSETTEEAIKMALKNKKSKGETILHSDRGFQYCNTNFVERNKKRGIIPSMTQNSDPYENAAAERLNGILKYEFALRYVFKSKEVAQQAIKEAVYLYNDYRLHWSLNLATPNFIYQQGMGNAGKIVT